MQEPCFSISLRAPGSSALSPHQPRARAYPCHLGRLEWAQRTPTIVTFPGKLLLSSLGPSLERGALGHSLPAPPQAPPLLNSSVPCRPEPVMSINRGCIHQEGLSRVCLGAKRGVWFLSCGGGRGSHFPPLGSQRGGSGRLGFSVYRPPVLKNGGHTASPQVSLLGGK